MLFVSKRKYKEMTQNYKDELERNRILSKRIKELEQQVHSLGSDLEFAAKMSENDSFVIEKFSDITDILIDEMDKTTKELSYYKRMNSIRKYRGH